MPRPVKYKTIRPDALPQRKTVRNKLVSRFEKTEARLAPAAKPARIEKEVKLKSSGDIAKKTGQVTSTEPSSDGHYELNSLMGKALESELQDVMIKVWQGLPDSPPSKADRLVADKLRNEVGDDLKNALGLNITKCILNIMSPLFVKIEFNKRPFGLSIQKFVRWLNCTAMKRVLDGGQHNYIARLRSPADLDRVTREPVTRIGGLTGKITPYYKFTKFPSKLKTDYKVSTKKAINENEQEVKLQNKNEESANKKCEAANKKTEAATVKPPQVSKVENTKPPADTPKKSEQPTKIETKPESVKTPSTGNVSAKANVVAKTATTAVDNVPAKANVAKATPTTRNTLAKVNVTKSAPTGNTPTKTNVTKTTAPTAAANVSKTAPATNTGNTPSKTNVAKPTASTPGNTPATVNVNKTAPATSTGNTPSKLNVAKTTTTAGNTPTTANVTKTAATTNTGNAPAKANVAKTHTTAANTPAKANVTKTVPSTATGNAPTKVSVAKTTPTAAGNTAAKSNVSAKTTPNKVEAKIAPKAKPVNKEVKKPNATKPLGPKVTSNKTKQRKNSDFDELNDEDILALMSNAIVLDECTGSDDD